jgi:hypothetical protein
VGALQNQIHDYNPGIAPNGVFWTVAVPASTVDVDPGAGRASFVARDMAVPDYGDFVNSIFPGVSVPATVSFDVRWHDILERTNRKNEEEGFAGEFVVTGSSMTWSSRQDGFEFRSDPADTSISAHAIVGHERNGVFL